MTASQERRRNPWVGFAFVMGAMVFGPALLAVPNTALSGIEADLDLSASGGALAWTLTFAALSAFVVPAGQLSDRFGKYRVFVLGGVSSTVVGVLTAASPSGDFFLTMRLLQGITLALIVAPATGIVNTIFTDARRRATAFGIFGLAIGIGLAAGPILGAVFTDWQMGFIVTGGLLLASTVGAQLTARFDQPDPNIGIDVAGAVLFGTSLTFLIIALDQGSTWGWFETNTVPILFGWNWPFTVSLVVVLVVVAFLGFMVLWLLERKLLREGRGVLIDPRFFRVPSYSIGLVSACALFFAMIPLFVVIPMVAQIILGQDPLEMAITILPLGLGTALGGLVSIPLGNMVGAKRTVVYGMMASAVASLVLIPVISTDISLPQLVFGLLAVGTASGVAYAKVTAVILQDIDPEDSGQGAGIMFGARATAGAFGSLALLAVIPIVVAHAAPTATAAADDLSRIEASQLSNGPANSQHASTVSGTPGKTPAEVAASNEIVKAQLPAYADAFKVAIGLIAAVYALGGVVAMTIPSTDESRSPPTKT